MKYLRPLILITLGLLLLLPLIGGTTGRINGILKGPDGAPVGGARLTLVDKDKGTTVSVTSDRKGSYTFPIVSPGTYNLHVEATGFAPLDRSSIVVHVDSVMKLDLSLEAGDAGRKKDSQ